MKRTLLAAALFALPACTHAPRSNPPSQLVVEEVARFEADQCTGVAVSKSGRVFASFPLWHDGHRLHVAEVNPADGTYWPYPDASWNSYREGTYPQSGSAPDVFICVQSVYVDDLDRLWVLDPASPRIQGLAANARPKLVRFNLQTNQPERLYFFEDAVCPPTSYLNDVRIDTRSNHAFMTDSSLGGLIVLNLETGVSRRVLGSHPSTMAEPDFVPIVEGRELRFAGGPNAGAVPQVQSDGLALDASRGWLYWQALTGRTLYRIPTAALMDPALTDDDLAARIENLGRTVMTDGMEIDARGNVYFSALEHDAVVVRTPEGKLMTLVASPLYAWPDSFALGPNNSLYFTVAQIHRTAWFNADGSMPKTPYRIFRTSQFTR